MQKEAVYLKDWFVRFLKNRDLAFRRIIGIEEKDDLIIVKESAKETVYKVVPFITDFEVDDSVQGLITYNTMPAFKALKASWKKLITHPNLVIYFINPFSKTDKKWIIRPRTHHFISDAESLWTGLDSLSGNVEFITKDRIKQIIN